MAGPAWVSNPDPRLAWVGSAGGSLLVGLAGSRKSTSISSKIRDRSEIGTSFQPTQETLIVSSSDYAENTSLLGTAPMVTVNMPEINNVDLPKTPTSEKVVLFSDQNDKSNEKLFMRRKNTPTSQKFSGASLHIPSLNDLGLAAAAQGNDRSSSSMSNQLKKIQRQLLQLNEYVRAKEEEERIHGEWEWLAAILDRVLLVVFVSIVTTVTLLIIFVGLWAKQKVSCSVE